MTLTTRTASDDLRHVEERIYEHLGIVFERRDAASLDLVRDIACQLSSYVADMAAVPNSCVMRRHAVDRLNHFKIESERLLMQLERQLDTAYHARHLN